MKIGILGVPFNGDGTRPEIENPAAALRQAGLSSLKFFSGNTMVKKVCYLFPGQGAQYVGMGKELYNNFPESKGVFDEAENVLPHANIKRLCFQGPLEELTQTAVRWIEFG